MKNPSIIEQASSNLLAEVTMTAIAACAGTPLAALLPVLSNTLANGRHKKRVEAAIEEINQELISQKDNVKNLTDSQYKIINEILLAVLQTTQQEKITYLKRAALTNVEKECVSPEFAGQVSRILRDISADELKFLIEHSQYSHIIFNNKPMNVKVYSVEPSSEEEAIVSGLVSMGLIIAGAATFDDVGRYRFSPLVKKVLKAVGT